jgi:Putative peptidoglycan binding domain
MKRKEIVSGLLLAAAVMAVSPGLTWSQSVGGTQSERSGGDAQIPVAPSPGDPSKAQKGSAGTSKSPSGTAQGTKDTSVGGTQSERSGGDSQTPLPKGSRSAGTEAGQSGRTASGLHGMSGAQDVRQAQEALKNQGHDPGPIDGVIGSQTRQALRDFQSKNGLRQTGTLNAETKQKLNIEGSGSGSMGSSSTRQKESSPMGK